MIMGSESAGLNELAAEFPGYDFGTQRTWDGTSIIAVRQDGMERPGLCVVITADVGEMRDALLEGERQHGAVTHEIVPHEVVSHGGVSHGGALPEPRTGT
jgi:hypothetical protein